MMFKLAAASQLTASVSWDLAQVQVMQAIQVQKLRPWRLTQGIIQVTSLHATGQYSQALSKTGPCWPRPAQGPLASDATCWHTVRSQSHGPNVTWMIICLPGVH
jgi:hypothetical protein